MRTMKRTIGDTVFDTFNYSVLFLLAFVTLYPFLHVVFSSLSRPDRLNAASGILFGPQGFSTKGYELTFKYPGILTGYGNTIFYVVVGTSFNVFFTGLLAYVLASKSYWKKYMMILVVITMFFSGGLIPTFLLVRSLGLLNNRFALIFPQLIFVWNLIIMRTFFMGIPDSLEESARIDGASPLMIFFKIILPLSKPVIAVMVLYYGVGHWNSWFNAMIFLKDRRLFPLQLFLRELLIQSVFTGDVAGGLNAYEGTYKDVNEDILKSAFIVVSTLPILCLYPFLQRYFIKGVMIGALKG